MTGISSEFMNRHRAAARLRIIHRLNTNHHEIGSSGESLLEQGESEERHFTADLQPSSLRRWFFVGAHSASFFRTSRSDSTHSASWLRRDSASTRAESLYVLEFLPSWMACSSHAEMSFRSSSIICSPLAVARIAAVYLCAVSQSGAIRCAKLFLIPPRNNFSPIRPDRRRLRVFRQARQREFAADPTDRIQA